MQRINTPMSDEAIKKEIHYRARRGMKETDMLLQRFLACGLDDLSQHDLEAVLALLKDTYDQDLMNWFFDGVIPPKDYTHAVQLIRERAKL